MFRAEWDLCLEVQQSNRGRLVAGVTAAAGGSSTIPCYGLQRRWCVFLPNCWSWASQPWLCTALPTL